MPIRYKFIRVEGGEALFSRDQTAFGEFLTKLLGVSVHLVRFTEKNCRELYAQACNHEDAKRIHTPTQNSKQEMKKGFYAIRNYKRQHGIAFDTDDV